MKSATCANCTQFYFKCTECLLEINLNSCIELSYSYDLLKIDLCFLSCAVLLRVVSKRSATSRIFRAISLHFPNSVFRSHLYPEQPDGWTQSSFAPNLSLTPQPRKLWIPTMPLSKWTTPARPQSIERYSVESVLLCIYTFFQPLLKLCTDKGDRTWWSSVAIFARGPNEVFIYIHTTYKMNTWWAELSFKEEPRKVFPQ